MTIFNNCIFNSNLIIFLDILDVCDFFVSLSLRKWGFLSSLRQQKCLGPFFGRRVCSQEETSLPLELVVLFYFGFVRKHFLIFFSPFAIFFSMDELANQWTKFSLSKKEIVGFILSKEQWSGEFLLAAQFLTPCFLNLEAMACTFK